MAKTPVISTKRLAISKANVQMVAIVAAASFVTIFCLFAAKAAFSLYQYQGRVTDAKQKAKTQLDKNVTAFDSLEKSYRRFDASSTNVIGGSRDGQADNDGPNSQLVLNALPTVYDFPALASSIEKILSQASLKVGSITGTDDEVNQQANKATADPQPIEIPFSFTVTDASYESVGKVVKALEQSIRPIQVDSINMTGGASSMTLTVNAHTYYQPAKDLSIKKQVVK